MAEVDDDGAAVSAGAEGGGVGVDVEAACAEGGGERRAGRGADGAASDGGDVAEAGAGESPGEFGGVGDGVAAGHEDGGGVEARCDELMRCAGWLRCVGAGRGPVVIGDTDVELFGSRGELIDNDAVGLGREHEAEGGELGVGFVERARRADECAEIGEEFDRGEGGGDGAVLVRGKGEVLGRDEEVEAREAQIAAAEQCGELTPGGAVEITRAEAGLGGVELNGADASGAGEGQRGAELCGWVGVADCGCGQFKPEQSERQRRQGEVGGGAFGDHAER